MQLCCNQRYNYSNICNKIPLSATTTGKAPRFTTFHNLVATKTSQYRFSIKLKSLSAVSGPVLPVCFDWLTPTNEFFESLVANTR